jgi:hypothetical protein
VKRLAVLGTVLGALAAPALAQAAPSVARPNPALVGIRLDYVNALPAPGILQPLGQSVIVAATDDAAFLRFRQLDDLGGFMPAPVGKLALSSGGRDIHPHTFAPEIPLFAHAAGDQVSSFLAGNSQASTTPDNGTRPVPGLGVPTPPPPPTASNTTPPANQGFGGAPGGNGGGGATGTTTTTTTRAAPPTTTTTTTTPTTAVTATTTSTISTTTTQAASAGGGGGGGGGLTGGSGSGDCGTPGLQIVSNPAGCVVSMASGAPGSSVSEVMTITNTSSSVYTVSLKAEGANNNHLWSDLEMGVYPEFTPPPSPLPPLAYWIAQFNDLTTLNPGQTIAYVIVLYLPTTAGNQDMGKSAAITFHWRATG